MDEKQWVQSIVADIEKMLQQTNNNIRVVEGRRLPYANEIISYGENNTPHSETVDYETDIFL